MTSFRTTRGARAPKKAWPTTEPDRGDGSRSEMGIHRTYSEYTVTDEGDNRRRKKQTVPLKYDRSRYDMPPQLLLSGQSRRKTQEAEETRLKDIFDELIEKIKHCNKTELKHFLKMMEPLQNQIYESKNALEKPVKQDGLMQPDTRPMTAPPSNYSDDQELRNQQGLIEKLNHPTSNESSQQRIKELDYENCRLRKHVSHETFAKPQTAPVRRSKKSPENEIEKLQSKIDQYEQERLISENTIQEQREKLKLAATKLKQIEREKEEALTRLSEIAGRRLRENNTAVADLSNENRPTKLAEKYKELYDNEWTNAFFEMGECKINNQDAIAYLLKILLDAYKFCMAYSDRQFMKLTAFETYKGHEDKDHKQNVQALELSSETLDLAKQLRKSASPAIVSTIQNAFMETQTAEWSKTHPDTEKYCRKCVEITWFMSVQIPPMALDGIPNRGEKVNLDSYAYYTVDGPFVDYVVWPACMIEKNGNILAKGVLQAQKSEKGSSQ